MFQWAKEKIEQYPNCEELMLQMAQIFDVWRVVQDVPDFEKYDEAIHDFYFRVLMSKDIRKRVA